MKRFLSLLLVLVLLCTALPLQTYAAVTRDSAAVDSDFDGIPDATDPSPNSNTFSGTYKSGNYTVNMTYTMDYRNFFGDNTVYNEAIAGFSTWAAQFAYEIEEKESDQVTYTPSVPLQDSDGSTISKVYHIDELMRAHGMEDVIDYRLENGYFDDSISLGAYADDDITEVFFGHHNVSYNGETIEVIALFVRGTNATEKEWCSNFDVGDLNRFGDEYDCVEGKSPRQLNGSWNRKSNHRGFDVCSNRIRVALQTYMETYLDEDTTPVFWLTGHSRGGAIANIVSSYLIDEEQKVFAYTFASPNTTANTEASAEKYDCIFNLVNGDDFVPMLPMPEWGFTRYGRSATVYASSVSSSDRSSLLSNTSYSYSTNLQTLVNKFVNMTKNNAGQIEGWRDVYVYHCKGGTDVDHDEMHQHAGETIGEFRTDSRMDFGTDSNWNGYNEHTKKYSYCVKDKDGGFLGLGNKYSCCQTPAYAMQILAITMGNLGLSAGWDFLTSYKLANRFDFGKTSLITSYATKIIDPHYMENYYLIQTILERDGDPDTAFSTASSLYTDNGRPVHTHEYTFHYYEGKEPTCTQEGEGYKICNCSQINSAWYDDVVNNVKVPALGHSMVYSYAGGYTHTVSCQRGDLEAVTEACVYDENNVCTLCGHVKAASRTVSVYVVDELNGQSLYAWAWGDAGNLDNAWPGHALTTAGTDKGNHPYYRIDLDVADYDKIIFNRNGQPQTATLNVATDAGENAYVVYYIYGVNGNDLQCSTGTDIWPAPGVVTEPTCTEGGYTTYTGLFTGETRIENATDALGHAPKAAVIENNVEPTCTAAGSYDSVVYCDRCGEEISRETVTVDALGHLPGEAVEENRVEPTATTDGGYDTVVYCQRCNAELSREHTVLPATGTEVTLTINNTLALDGATTLNYILTKSELDALGLTDVKVIVVHTACVDGEYVDETVELTDWVYYDQAQNYLLFKYENIAAKELNDKMVAHVEGVKDGVTFTSNEKEYNPMTYCYTIAQRETANANLRKTCADMIKYCAAAQECFSYNTANLADADWNDTIAAVATQGDPDLANYKEDVALEGQTAAITTYTLDVSGRVNINYYVLPDDMASYESLTLVCTYKDVKGHTVTTEIPGADWELFNTTYGYKATLNTVNAGEMREIITAVVKDANGNVISNTYKTSIETYAKTIVDRNNNQPLMKLMKAMLNYGTSAQALLG